LTPWICSAIDFCNVRVKMFLCQRYTGEKLKDIGTYFGIGESGVSQACRRVKDKIRNDKKLERKINVSRMMT